MRRLWLRLLIVAVFIAVPAGCALFTSTSSDSSTEIEMGRADARSECPIVVPTPSNPADLTPPITMLNGCVPIEDSPYPLGMGCEQLDFYKVNALVRQLQIDRGVTRTFAPGGVMACRQVNDQWLLRVWSRIGEEPFDKAIAVPGMCQQNSWTHPSEHPDCDVDSAEVVEVSRQSGNLVLTVRATSPEVMP